MGHCSQSNYVSAISKIVEYFYGSIGLLGVVKAEKDANELRVVPDIVLPHQKPGE